MLSWEQGMYFDVIRKIKSNCKCFSGIYKLGQGHYWITQLVYNYISIFQFQFVSLKLIVCGHQWFFKYWLFNFILKIQRQKAEWNATQIFILSEIATFILTRLSRLSVCGAFLSPNCRIAEYYLNQYASAHAAFTQGHQLDGEYSLLRPGDTGANFPSCHLLPTSVPSSFCLSHSSQWVNMFTSPLASFYLMPVSMRMQQLQSKWLQNN